MVEQRYQAVLAVIADGLSVKVAAEKAGVSRQTLHAWLSRYEAEGLEGLSDRSRRPVSCPHQMPAAVEAVVLELRRVHRFWGPRRILHELLRRNLVAPEVVPSESAIYRALVRAGLIEASGRRRRSEKFKRWERAAPMELWQMDVVGGFLLADGTSAKALTGIDDHSRFCVSARLMQAERTKAVCDGLAAALRVYGCPSQLLTDNGRVFTGRYFHPPVEVLFDRVCRENGIEHLLTAPYSPTTTGKIERFHRTLRRGSTRRACSPACGPRRPRWMNGSPSTTPTVPTSRWTAPPRPSGSGSGTTSRACSCRTARRRRWCLRRGRLSSAQYAATAAARDGSRARPAPTGSSASHGSRSASAPRTPAPVSTSTSCPNYCRSGAATN